MPAPLVRMPPGVDKLELPRRDRTLGTAGLPALSFGGTPGPHERQPSIDVARETQCQEGRTGLSLKGMHVRMPLLLYHTTSTIQVGVYSRKADIKPAKYAAGKKHVHPYFAVEIEPPSSAPTPRPATFLAAESAPVLRPTPVAFAFAPPPRRAVAPAETACCACPAPAAVHAERSPP